jgi:hypothetical protein
LLIDRYPAPRLGTAGGKGYVADIALAYYAAVQRDLAPRGDEP